MRGPSDPFIPREPRGVTLDEHSAQGRRRLAALPLWLAAAILIGSVGVLAVIMQCISAAYLATVIAVSARLGHRASGRPGLAIGAHLVAGTAFCLFAIKLASASF